MGFADGRMHNIKRLDLQVSRQGLFSKRNKDAPPAEKLQYKADLT
jgi:hypothetical protein